MLGSEFRALREAAHLTYAAAAREFGCSISTIQRWESGTQIPSRVADQLRSRNEQVCPHCGAAIIKTVPVPA